MELTKTEFNREYLIRYFPDTKDRHTNKLIGLDRFKQLVDDPDIVERKLKKVEDNREDKIEVRLRRGVRFVFVRK